MSEKIETLKKWIQTGQVVTDNGRIYEDLFTLVNQIELEFETLDYYANTDLRPTLLKHKNQDMVKRSCLHYLGNSIIQVEDMQEFIENDLLKTGKFQEFECTKLASIIIDNLKK